MMAPGTMFRACGQALAALSCLLLPATGWAAPVARGGFELSCDAAAVRGAADAAGCYRDLAATTSSPAVRAEALWRAGDLGGANAAFRQAVAAAPDDATLRARWGRLFLRAHQAADAEALFQESLARDPDDEQALLGMAELSLGRFEAGVRSHLARVLKRNPEHPEANLLLARMRLELGEVEVVQERIRELLDRGAFARWLELDAYAVLAAADALAGVSPSPWTARALERNPAFGDVHALSAHYFVINRRYREAVAAYRQAVVVEPDHWGAHAELGINLLRVEAPEEARRHLERAYAGDPYNPLTVNTLRLLDLLDGEFATLREPGLLMRAPKAQADALAPDVRRLVSRAAEEMADRYGYVPTGPVVIELYEHHDDFAVRTAGLPGLGILGATFGDVVVMDGPAAKGIDEGFDWASALWHELAHVYTLGATDNRVSRWFSEGVSVMEEWRYGPTPNGSVPLSFLEALADDRLLPVAELDEGFLRPRYPEQIGVSYLQAGLLCELIDERFDTGLSRMLDAYADGDGTADAIRRGLGIEPEALDTMFRETLAARFGPLLEELAAFRETVEQTHVAAAESRWADAREAGRRAVARYPDFVGSGSVYVPLARAAGALEDWSLLDETLDRYFARGGRDPWALDRLAQRRAAQGRADAEIDVLRVLSRTRPLDATLRARLGDRLLAAGRHEAALEHFTVALALDPHDRARAQLRLADTYHRLGRIEEARRALLLALEIAPTYAPALDLLLTLNALAPAVTEDGSDHE